MPRFVILFHDCPTDSPSSSHFDLMLESNGVLRTWAIAAPPCSWGATAGLPSSANAALSESVAATQLPDHRLDYLDYEGPVSGDRGKVSRIDAGEFVSREEATDLLVVTLSGERIRGQLKLARVAGESTQWQLTFLPVDEDAP
jgi:hypothetical protein